MLSVLFPNVLTSLREIRIDRGMFSLVERLLHFDFKWLKEVATSYRETFLIKTLNQNFWFEACLCDRMQN